MLHMNRSNNIELQGTARSHEEEILALTERVAALEAIVKVEETHEEESHAENGESGQ